MELALYKAMYEVEERHWWFTARRHIVQQMLLTLDLPIQAQLLDMGCGTGGNLAMLGQFGDVTAVEMESVARELANSRNIAAIYEGFLPHNLPAELTQYDAIILLDVLEHVEDDFGALQVLREHLKPNGTLLITVPALPCLWGHHDVIHHHHRRYTRRGLEAIAQQAGLTVDKLSYCNSWLLPLVAAARLVEKLLPTRRSTGVTGLSIPASSINSLLHNIFASEAGRVTGSGFSLGVSLISTLRRSGD